MMPFRKNLKLTVLIISSLFSSALLLFVPTLLRIKGIFHNDLAIADFARQYFIAQNLQKGIFPLWDPHLWCGAIPYYSFPYSGNVYYFLLWPFYLSANLSSIKEAYLVLSILPLLLHYCIAASGMFLLLNRIVKCGKFASFIGSFAYIYSPAFVYSYTCQYNLIMQAWLPWLLFCYVKTVENFSCIKLFFTSLLVAFMWFGSKLQYMPFMMIIWGGFVLLLSTEVSRPVKLDKLFKPVLIAFAAFILGSLISAPFLLSLFDGMRYVKIGTELTLENVIRDSTANLLPSYLVTIFLPNLFGSITGENFIFKRLLYFYANLSGGLAITFAVILGSIFSLRSFLKPEAKHKTKFAILGIFFYIFAILCAMGGNSPFYKLFVGWIPFIGRLPIPIRFRFIQCFAVSLLIAIGLNGLIRLEYSLKRFRIKKIVLVYFFVVFCLISLVLLIPQRKNLFDLFWQDTDYKILGYFDSRQPVGLYTPRMSRMRSINVLFDGPSKGQIRYSENHFNPPEAGRLVREYSTEKAGWVNLSLDIPPNKFLWLFPKEGPGRIGYWKSYQICFNYNNGWNINTYINGVRFSEDKKLENASYFVKVISHYCEYKPILGSLFYFLAVLLLFVVALFILSPRRFGYFLGFIIILEFSIFGLMAFYGCTFNEDPTRTREFITHNSRSLSPVSHPFFQIMVNEMNKLTGKDRMRVASDYPFLDNYAYLNNKYSFMGEPPFPLEKRFYSAVNSVYRESIEPNVFYNGGGDFPLDSSLLSNFSVRYFLSKIPLRVFINESISSFSYKNATFFVHVNNNALPRVYTSNILFESSDEEQFKELISGDLRKGVYLNALDYGKVHGSLGNFRAVDFDALQNLNKVGKIVLRNPNKIELEIDVKIPSMLVFTEVWHPGWKAFVDKNSVKLYRVNYCQRGVWLDKGFHYVQLEFRPVAWFTGAWISISVVILMSVIIFIIYKRK